MKHILWCLLLLGQTMLAQEDVTDVSGNPYLFKDWNNGIVRFSSKREMKQFRLKFDVFKNQLLLQFEGSTFAAESKVQEFVILPKGKDSMLFRKGFPPHPELFYQVLFNDKVQLLRLFSRSIIEEKTLVVSGKNNRHLEEVEAYYLFQNNQLTELPASNTAQAFPDKKAELAALAGSSRMRTPEDFIALVKKYNGLL